MANGKGIVFNWIHRRPLLC